MRKPYVSTRTRLGAALGASSLASLLFYIVGLWVGSSAQARYLPGNLALAWVALAAALWLERTVQRQLWSSWFALLMTCLWLLLLPNTFYLLSDFIHLQEVDAESALYDVILFSSFILNGLMLGLISLAIVHRQLIKRVGQRDSFTLVGIVLLICSFAVYVGRELRWNAWDVLVHPSSVLFDVSDHLLKPWAHPQMLVVTLGFFILLTCIYVVVWFGARVAKTNG